jgi:hypothetical protein
MYSEWLIIEVEPTSRALGTRQSNVSQSILLFQMQEINCLVSLEGIISTNP